MGARISRQKHWAQLIGGKVFQTQKQSKLGTREQNVLILNSTKAGILDDCFTNAVMNCLSWMTHLATRQVPWKSPCLSVFIS